MKSQKTTDSSDVKVFWIPAIEIKLYTTEDNCTQINTLLNGRGDVVITRLYLFLLITYSSAKKIDMNTSRVNNGTPGRFIRFMLLFRNSRNARKRKKPCL